MARGTELLSGRRELPRLKMVLVERKVLLRGRLTIRGSG